MSSIIRELKKTAGSYYKNLRGWRTNKKIVVIESDDWGSTRTSSKKALEYLQNAGIKIEHCHYTLYDSLASNDDLELLFDVLNTVKDGNGDPAVLTANFLVANPNFEKIRDSQFQNYYYETLETTFGRYPKHNNALKLWKDGINQSVFFPQSHGREHINVPRWLSLLRKNDPDTRLMFDLEMFGLSANIGRGKNESHRAAFDGGFNSIVNDRRQIIKDALALFYEQFGYSSESFIAPNYVWDNDVEESLSENGVKYIQGAGVQRISSNVGEKRRYCRHKMGEKNSKGQYYLIRNCTFEPSSNRDKDWVQSCMREISTSFFMKKPAIIDSHRVNYVGYLNEANRDNSLKQLKTLLKAIVNKWPDVRFITSDKLGKMISEED